MYATRNDLETTVDRLVGVESDVRILRSKLKQMKTSTGSAEVKCLAEDEIACVHDLSRTQILEMQRSMAHAELRLLTMQERSLVWMKEMSAHEHTYSEEIS